MRWKPPRIHRNLDDPVTGFQVLGERSSGTNYVTQLLLANLQGVERHPAFGWKHGFIDRRVAAEPGLLTVLVTRHPLRWLQSIHVRPLDLAASMRGLPFGAFIRHEWQGAFKDDNGGEKPSHADMVPHVGGNYPDAISLRNAKLAYLAEMAEMPGRLAILRFEDANCDPQATLLALAAGFELSLGPFRPVRHFKGKSASAYVPKQMPAVTAPDLTFIRERLDHAQEARLGYDLDDVPRFDGLPAWDLRSLRSLWRGVRR